MRTQTLTEAILFERALIRAYFTSIPRTTTHVPLTQLEKSCKDSDNNVLLLAIIRVLLPSRLPS